MTTYASLGAARMAMMTFVMNAGAEIDSAIKGKLMDLALSPSPVDQIVRTAEYLYANQATIGKEGRELAGGLAGFAALNSFHGMGGEDNRGGRIAQAMQRENGGKPKGVTLPKAADDPAPLAEYA